MLTRDETDQSEQTRGPSRQPRLRRYIVRRGRQLSRVVLILAVGLLFIAGLVELWRGASLLRLPDVGDPFDVAAFRAFRVPADQDAFVLMREAQAKLSRMPGLPLAARRLGPTVSWSKAEPELRTWAEANRDVLEMFRQATNRPDGILHPVVDRTDRYQFYLGQLVWLTLLEASRLEEQGDMSGAWRCYRVVLRARVHVMRRGAVYERLIAEWSSKGLSSRIATWASDKRTTLALLSRALDDVRAGEPKPEWDASSLKIEYLERMSEFDQEWGIVQQGDDEDQLVRIGGEDLPRNIAGSIYAVRRYLLHEPERSRRVLRLVFANWLAHVEEKDARHRKPAVRATFARGKQKTTLFFYAQGPDGPAAARALLPGDLASWLFSTRDAKLLLDQYPWPSVRTSEQREHHALVVMLAGELYRRERGKPAPSDEALVGPYLDHLPDDGSDELDDGKAPMVQDPKSPALGKSG